MKRYLVAVRYAPGAITVMTVDARTPAEACNDAEADTRFGSDFYPDQPCAVVSIRQLHEQVSQ